MRSYFWNLGVAISIFINALIPGAQRAETLCARCARWGCRFCVVLGRLVDLFEPDHFQKSRRASRDSYEKLRDDLEAMLDRHKTNEGMKK